METQSFLKYDPSPIEKKLPFETNGLGSFEPYSAWAQPSMVVKGTIRQGSMHSPGFSLVATVTAVIPANSNLTFSTNVSLNIPFGHFGRIEAIDCLLTKHIVPFSQIIESNYCEKIKVCLRNYSDTDYSVNKGDAISQIIFQRYVTPRILQQNK